MSGMSPPSAGQPPHPERIRRANACSGASRRVRRTSHPLTFPTPATSAQEAYEAPGDIDARGLLSTDPPTEGDRITEDEQARLEREIAERLQRLEALKKPMTPAETRELARTDPDEFNRRVDGGFVPASVLGAKEA